MPKRTYPEAPIVGVGAVIFRNNKVLLIRRGNPPLKGTWSLPGGMVEEGETLANAVAREVKEECGADVEVKDLVDIFEYRERDKDDRVKYHYIVFDFYAVFRRGTVSPRSDAADVRWVGIDELPLEGMTPQVQEMIEKAIGLYKKRES